jgi:hypothetical protein
LALFKNVDAEILDRQVERMLMSRDGKYVFEATLLALRGDTTSPPP